MPRLTPEQLHEARLASGKLGGRPRKPTADEARAAALEVLVPRALAVLGEALDSGRPDAWRPALRILDHAWGRPGESLDPEVVIDGLADLRQLTQRQLDARHAALLAAYPHLALAAG